MSESTAGQLTLRDINAKLQGAGLDILRPEQIKSIGAYTTRERFVQALEVVPIPAPFSSCETSSRA